jgi:hypothetical protein
MDRPTEIRRSPGDTEAMNPAEISVGRLFYCVHANLRRGLLRVAA